MTILTLGWYGSYVTARMIDGVNLMSRAEFGGKYKKIGFSKNLVGLGLTPFLVGVWLVVARILLDTFGMGGGVIDEVFWYCARMDVIVAVLAIAVVTITYVYIKSRFCSGRLVDICLEIGADRFYHVGTKQITENDCAYLKRITPPLKSHNLFNALVDYYNGYFYNSSTGSDYQEDRQSGAYTGEQEQTHYDHAENNYTGNTGEGFSVAYPFEVLGVTETASESEVKAAYRQKCILWHPDKFTPEQRKDPTLGKMINDEMSKINNAYEQIKQRKGWK